LKLVNGAVGSCTNKQDETAEFVDRNTSVLFQGGPLYLDSVLEILGKSTTKPCQARIPIRYLRRSRILRRRARRRKGMLWKTVIRISKGRRGRKGNRSGRESLHGPTDEDTRDERWIGTRRR
jgi:hypothetical protein